MEYLCQKCPRICSICRTSRSFPQSWYINGLCSRVYMTVSLMEHELLTLSKHMSSPPVFSVNPIARSCVYCVMFCRSLFVLCLFCLVIVLSVLRFTDSDYPFGIFKLFLQQFGQNYCNKATSLWTQSLC